MKTFCVLVLEDDMVTLVTLGKAIRVGVPDALVLTAHSLAEARLTLKEYEVNFFVLDINLPDGSGIDFILDVATANLEAPIVLITSTPLPEYRDQAAAYGVMNFMPKPVDNQKLVQLIKESLEESRKVAPVGKEGATTVLGASLNRLKRLVGLSEEGATAPPTARPGDTRFFKASLSRLTVLDIIQLNCLNSATKAVMFKSTRHGSGRIFFRNGDIIHAETTRATGMTALSEIIGWKGGEAEELPQSSSPERTIAERWQTALLIAAQTTDEGGGGATPATQAPSEPRAPSA